MVISGGVLKIKCRYTPDFAWYFGTPLKLQSSLFEVIITANFQSLVHRGWVLLEGVIHDLSLSTDILVKY